MSGTGGLIVRDLCLERGTRRLIEGLSFIAAAGDHVALVGPNGSGKTSLLRAIAGFIRPLAGTISAMGASDPEERGLKLHFLGHRDGLKSLLTARAHVEFWRDLFGGAGATDEALAQVGLARAADLPARALSAGQSRRLALTRLLVAPRGLWLLDEPAAALDADGKVLLERLIAAHTAAGGIALTAVHEPLGAPTAQVSLERAA